MLRGAASETLTVDGRDSGDSTARGARYAGGDTEWPVDGSCIYNSRQDRVAACCLPFLGRYFQGFGGSTMLRRPWVWPGVNRAMLAVRKRQTIPCVCDGSSRAEAQRDETANRMDGRAWQHGARTGGR
eukprot:scaffold461_cov321-Pavlova_lutheri.AAC.7